MLKHAGKNDFGNRSFLVRDWQASLANVKGTFGSPPIGPRVVYNSIKDSMARKQIIAELVLVSGQTQQACEPMSIHYEGAFRQLQRLDGIVAEMRMKEILDTRIDRYAVIRKQPILLSKTG